MKTLSLAHEQHLAGTRKPRGLDALACRLVLGKLGKLRTGSITVVDGENRLCFGERNSGSGLAAELRVLDPTFYSDLAFGGSIGAGEAFMRGAWQCNDLVALVRILLRNRQVLEDMESGTALLTVPLQKLFHWVNRNSRAGARRNISAHYDVGNDFFRLWLDESMMYSCAMFANSGMSLNEAQRHRLDVICRKLELEPSDHLVEIGTGWGGFAIHAARHYGCRVTTTTISREQFNLARKRVAEAGLQDRIELRLEDYRDLSGRYDKLVSIEMIEAIGSGQYDTYFRKCADLLKPGGAMLIQAITIADQRFDYARRHVDFIQRYIFPGACLPCVSVMAGSIARVSEMLVTGIEDIGRDYALTLNHWRHNFLNQIDRIRNLGYPEPFIRMWLFYLAYCEGGFLERAISDVHLMAEKPL